jgi:hypothetical protein
MNPHEPSPEQYSAVRTWIRVLLWVVHGSMLGVVVYAFMDKPVPMLGWTFKSPVVLALGFFFVGVPLATVLVRGIVTAVAMATLEPVGERPVAAIAPSAAKPTIAHFGFVETDHETQVVGMELYGDWILATIDMPPDQRSPFCGMAHLVPKPARASGSVDQAECPMVVEVVLEGAFVGHLEEAVASEAAKRLLAFRDETGLNVYCSAIIESLDWEDGPSELLGFSVEFHPDAMIRTRLVG